jgi:exodeoxyribonuclease-1
MAVVWNLAPHPTNRNEVIVWDLDHDPRILTGLDEQTVRRRLFTAAEALPAGETRLPIKTIHVNRAPIVIANLNVLGPAAARFGIDLARARHHAALAGQLPDLSALWAGVFRRPPAAAPVDVEEDLYGGFLGEADRHRLDRLRGLAPEGLAQPRAFDDPRLAGLLFRYRARHFPDTLDAAERARWAAHCRARLHDGADGAATLAQFQERVDALAEAAVARDDERAQDLLAALMDWAQTIAPDLA